MSCRKALAFIKNKIGIASLHPRILTRYLKGHKLPIKYCQTYYLRRMVSSDSILNLAHIEIISICFITDDILPYISDSFGPL